MPFNNKLTCPECQSPQLRESKWHSRTEKHAHPGKHPYRCIECSHRFLGPERKHTVNTTLLAVTGSVVLTGLVGVVVLFSFAPDLEEQRTPVALDAYALLNAETMNAAEAGDAEAQFRVGRKLLLDATLDGRKGAQGLEWLTRAAENGHTTAMIQLARMFRTGIGALQNYTVAAHWVERAAHAEDPEGMLELGRFYRDGVGFDKDPVHAYVWMNRSAAKHHLEAVREREAVIQYLSVDDLKRAQELSLEPIPEFIAKEEASPSEDPPSEDTPTAMID